MLIHFLMMLKDDAKGRNVDSRLVCVCVCVCVVCVCEFVLRLSGHQG